MATRLRTQRLGRGGPTYQAKKKGRMNITYYDFNKTKKEALKGQVISLLKEPARQVVVAKVLLENDSECFMLAPEGMQVGQKITIGNTKELEIGNILPLKNITEGCPVFNIEMIPGDGGKLIRSSGGYGLLVSKDKKTAVIKQPSGKIKKISLDARATIGCLSGGERTDKPLVKAGKGYYYYKSKGKKHAKVRGVAMNPSDHPHGGSQHHVGKSKSVKRGTPPGRKVGHIASRRTGRRKK